MRILKQTMRHLATIIEKVHNLIKFSLSRTMCRRKGIGELTCFHSLFSFPVHFFLFPLTSESSSTNQPENHSRPLFHPWKDSLVLGVNFLSAFSSFPNMDREGILRFHSSSYETCPRLHEKRGENVKFHSLDLLLFNSLRSELNSSKRRFSSFYDLS